MAEDKVLPKGIRFFNPHENAPDFVVASLVITPNDLVSFLKERPDLLTDYNGAKQIRLQVLKSQKGELYSVVDTYKKGDPKPQAAKPKQQAAEVVKPKVNDDLPF